MRQILRIAPFYLALAAPAASAALPCFTQLLFLPEERRSALFEDTYEYFASLGPEAPHRQTWLVPYDEEPASTLQEGALPGPFEWTMHYLQLRRTRAYPWRTLAKTATGERELPSGATNETVRDRVAEALRDRNPTPRWLLDGRGTGLTEAEAIHGVFRARRNLGEGTSFPWRLLEVRILGDGFEHRFHFGLAATLRNEYVQAMTDLSATSRGGLPAHRFQSLRE